LGVQETQGKENNMYESVVVEFRRAVLMNSVNIYNIKLLSTMIDLIIALHLFVHLMPSPASSYNSKQSKFYRYSSPDCKELKVLNCSVFLLNLIFKFGEKSQHKTRIPFTENSPYL